MRTMHMNIDGDQVTLDSAVAGVQGSGNVDKLVVHFDAAWDGYAKRACWWDSHGVQAGQPRVLTADLLVDLAHDTRTYVLTVPPSALRCAGMCTLVIDGYSGGALARTVSQELQVVAAPGRPAEDDMEPSQAQQLQEQVENILEDMSELAMEASSSAEDAMDKAEYAAEQANAARESRDQAQEFYAAAELAEQRASERADEAQGYRDEAQGFRDEASGYADNAFHSFDGAQACAFAASTNATYALQHKNDAQVARDGALAAQGGAEAARDEAGKNAKEAVSAWYRTSCLVNGEDFVDSTTVDTGVLEPGQTYRDRSNDVEYINGACYKITIDSVNVEYVTLANNRFQVGDIQVEVQVPGEDGDFCWYITNTGTESHTVVVARARTFYGTSIKEYDRRVQQNAQAAEQSAQAALESVSRPNLLDNWYFIDPINQRGGSAYSNPLAGLAGGKAFYGLDRWVLRNGDYDVATRTFARNNGAPYLIQPLQAAELAGKTVTASVLFGSLDGQAAIMLGNSPSPFSVGSDYGNKAGSDLLLTTTVTLPDSLTNGDLLNFVIRLNSGSAVITAAKLELGDSQTLARQDGEGGWVLNDPPPDKRLELVKCQRYFQVFRNEGWRPAFGEDFRPVMATAIPTTGTLAIGGVTYYTASSEP